MSGLAQTDRAGQTITTASGKYQLWAPHPDAGTWWAVPLAGGKAVAVKRVPANRRGVKQPSWELK